VATLVGSGAAASVAPSRSSGTGFTIKSTLDGKTVLPHRIRWIAAPGIPAAKVREVDFLIDGKVAWIEKAAPYVYGEDDGPHRGYLVTSWLASGRHTFTAKAVARDGRTASTTLKTSVALPTKPTAKLSGTWLRTIPSTSAAPPDGSSGNPTGTHTPPGTYRMVIDQRFLQVHFPGRFHRPQSDDTGNGWILDTDYIPRPNSLSVLGPVPFAPFNGQAEGGPWCYVDGPPASYNWAVSGNQLTLKPAGSDKCGIRAFVFAGTWKRAQ